MTGVALTPNGFFSGLSMVLGGVLVNPEIRKIIKARTTYPIWLCLIACILAFFVSIALWERLYPFLSRRLRPLRWEMNCVCYLLDRAS